MPASAPDAMRRTVGGRPYPVNSWRADLAAGGAVKVHCGRAPRPLPDVPTGDTVERQPAPAVLLRALQAARPRGLGGPALPHPGRVDLARTRAARSRLGAGTVVREVLAVVVWRRGGA